MSSSTFAIERLQAECKNFRKDHPLKFFAKPVKLANGSTNYFMWKCGVPGISNTPWEGPIYELTLSFTENYPNSPPKAIFVPTIKHPNIYPDGSVCLSLLSKDWKPSINIKQILAGIQNMLIDPNPASPANSKMSDLFRKNRKEYESIILEQAKKYKKSS